MNTDKAVAIVGIAGLFPGANNLEEFMELLEKGQCQSKPIPKERFDTDKYYDENRNAPGKTYVKNASLIDGFEKWDHKFFDIGQRTAEKMDPQHKFALEVTFRALENGGISLDDIKGSNTSVYIGQMNSDFKEVTSLDYHEMSASDPVGQSMAILANQISFTFDLRGESLALDTACSSSMIAIHKGTQTILDGSCEMSICGGVNFILSPTNFMGLSKAGMISPKGICHSFSNKADGYGRGEGCGVVILKSIEQAKKDGNKVWGYIVTDTNQDGHDETPITAPSGSQQEKLIKTIYKKHQVKVENIGYIEAHGTVTPVGDPIEVKALGKALGDICPNRKETIYIGSVKSNIGHLESAAGVVGLIKLLLCMEHKKIVPSLHCEEGFNEKIPFQELNLKVPLKVMDWESPKTGRRIGILNCFGFGGSNSHAVVMEPEISLEKEPGPDNKGTFQPMVVALSAKSRESLTKTAQFYHQEVLKSQGTHGFDEIAWTSTCSRQHFSIRKAFVANTNEGLCQELEKWIKSPKIEETKKDVQNIWVFCGMGTHWKGMCKELLKNKHFAETMKQIDEAFQKFSSFSILEKIEAEEDFSNPSIGQPALFAMQVSLARLWQHWGIKPDVIIGHSVGEVAAAHIAGQLTLGSAVKVIYHRGRLLERVKGGTMLVVGNFPVEEVLKMIDSLGEKVSMAAKNSPISCTLSGEVTALEEIASALKSKKDSVFLRKLDVQVAYHSKFMDPILDEFQKCLAVLESDDEKSSKMISTVTGNEASKDSYCSSIYWKNNMRQSVLFDSAITAALGANKHNLVLEIGPRPALQSYIKDIATSLKVPFSMHPSVKPREEWITMQRSLGQIYEKGIKIDWKNVHNGKKMSPIPIPRYQFDKKDVFVLKEKARDFLSGNNKTNSNDHPFIRPTNDINTMKVIISPDTTPFVYQHKLDGLALMPGATYGEILLSSAFLFWKEKYPIECMGAEVEFLKKVALENDKEEKELTIHIKEVVGRKDTLQCSIFCGNIEHAGGTVFLLDGLNQGIDKISIKDIEKKCKEEIKVDVLYDYLSKAGFSYGASLRGITKVFKSPNECIADLKVPLEIQNEVKKMAALHPAILDNIFQLLVVFMYNKDEDEVKALPVGLKKIIVQAPVKTDMRVYMKHISQTSNISFYNAVLVDLQGKVIAECEGITCMTLSSNNSTMSAETKEYQLEWVEIPTDAALPQDEEAGNPDEGFANTTNYLLISKKVDQGLALFMNSEEHRTKVLSPQCLPKEWEQNRDVIEQFVNIYNIKFDVIEAVIYIPEVYNENEMNTKDGQDICKMVIALCTQLQFLLKVCQMYSKQLVVVTEYGQPLTTTFDDAFRCENRGSIINFYHAPLWSFVRSYLCENPSAAIKMIDIQDLPQPGDLVRELLPPYEEPEIVLSQGKVYKVLLRIAARRNSSNVPLKKMAPVEGQKFQLKATDIKGGTKLHFCPCFKENLTHRKNRSNDLVEIKVMRAFLPVDALFPTTKESIKAKKSEIWPLDGPTTFPMVGMEFQGKFAHIRSEKEEQDVVVCCPLFITSTFEVDPKFVIPQKKLTKSKGFLWLLVLAYEILKKGRNIDKKSSVLILGDKNQELVIEKVLKACCKAMGIAVECDVQKHLGKSIHLIVVLPTGISDLTKVQPHLSKETSIIVLQNLDCVQEVHGECWALQETCQHVSHVDPLEVFRPADLSRNLPKVINWINSHEMKQLRLDIPTTDVVASTIDYSSTENQGAMRMVSLSNAQNTPVYASEKELFSRRACYIIIGGAKGLGMVAIKEIAERRAGFILCISRSKPSSDIKKEFHIIQEKWKTEIRCCSVDACDLVGLEQALKGFQQAYPGIPFKGIIFGAAVLEDCVFAKMTEEKFEKAVRPKVVGAWNMHKLSIKLKMDLDYFVLHSSVVSILGNQGQTNYAVGNGFMDALAHYRNALGLCGQSINWGALDLGLLKTSPEAKTQLAMKGIYAIEKDDIAAFLRNALVCCFTQIMVCQFNIRQLATQKNKQQPSLAAKLREFIPHFSLSRSKGDQDGGPKNKLSVEELRSTEYPKAVTMVKEYLTKLVREIVNVDMATLADDTVFASMGVDSMAVSQIEQNIESDIQIQIKVNSDIDTFESLSKNIADIIQNKDGQQQRYKIDMKPFITEPIFQETVDSSFCEQKHQGLVTVMQLQNLPMDNAFWEGVFCILMERLTILRTTYPKDKNGQYVVNIFDAKSAPLKIHSNKEFDTLEDIKTHFGKFVKIFDVTKELPVEVHLASSKDRDQVMVLVISKLAVEYGSISVLFQEIQGILRAKLERIPPPPRLTNLEYGNLVKYREEMRRQMKDQSLAMYKEILTEKPVPFFEDEIKVENDWPCNPSSTLISNSAYHSALNICKQFKITMFELCHGIFHLFLHAISSKDSVYCNVTVNVRAGIESLENIVGRGTGKMLLPSRIDDLEESFETYVKDMALKIKKCKPHADFTNFEEIFEHSPDFHRTLGMLPVSTLIEMDLETRRGTEDYGAGPVEVYNPHTSLVWQIYVTFVQNKNREKLTYQLRTNRKYVSFSREESLESRFGKVFEAVCENPQMTVKDYFRLCGRIVKDSDEDGSSGIGTERSHDKTRSSMGSLDSFDIEEENASEWQSFQKRSKKGSVSFLSSVQIGANADTNETCLLWTKRNNNKINSIPLLSLKESYYIKENGGFTVVLEQTKRKLILETREEKDVKGLLGKIVTKTRNHYNSIEVSH